MQEKQRWNWRSWQALVEERTEDEDARKLAEVWPVFARTQQHGRRGMWAHELTYTVLKGWDMGRVMKAANTLETCGLSSRCPGTPLYLPTIGNEATR